MDRSIKYWTKHRCVVFHDYLIRDGEYFLALDGIYYKAERDRIMLFAGVTASGVKLHERDIIEYEVGGVTYRDPIIYDKALNTFMVSINKGAKRRVLGKFIMEHPEITLVRNEFENDKVGTNIIPFPSPAPLSVHSDNPIDDEEIVSIHIASSKVNDGEESGYAKWAYIMLRGNKYAEKTGEGKLTANRAYLISVINALSRVKQGSKVYLYTKSSYITDAFNKGWLQKWKAAGWLRGDLEPVQNVDEWKLIDQLAQELDLTMHRIDKKTDNDAMQERCESLIKTNYEGKQRTNYA